MSVTYQGSIAEKRTATNAAGIRTYSETFRLTSDSKSDTASTVGNNASLPSIGSVYADDGQAYCTNLAISCTDGYTGWEAVASWTTERTMSSTDPEDDEVKVSWTTEVYQEPVFQDVDGNAVVNSAGDYFIDPVPTRDATHLIARIRSNHRTIPAWVLAKQNNVNDSQITVGGLVIGAGLARMSRLEISERQRRKDVDFYSMSFELHIHKDGWLLEPMDVGFRELKDGELVQIKDTNEDEVTTPVMLDGQGVAQTNPTPSSAVFGSYQVYGTSDLSTLPGID
jgi:hypothetical protein